MQVGNERIGHDNQFCQWQVPENLRNQQVHAFTCIYHKNNETKWARVKAPTNNTPSPCCDVVQGKNTLFYWVCVPNWPPHSWGCARCFKIGVHPTWWHQNGRTRVMHSCVLGHTSWQNVLDLKPYVCKCHYMFFMVQKIMEQYWLCDEMVDYLINFRSVTCNVWFYVW
jgi:hypothetical protein